MIGPALQWPHSLIRRRERAAGAHRPAVRPIPRLGVFHSLPAIQVHEAGLRAWEIAPDLRKKRKKRKKPWRKELRQMPHSP
jgi:hypothetical protein